jgi:hypothetical protein
MKSTTTNLHVLKPELVLQLASGLFKLRSALLQRVCKETKTGIKINERFKKGKIVLHTPQDHFCSMNHFCSFQTVENQEDCTEVNKVTNGIRPRK